MPAAPDSALRLYLRVSLKAMALVGCIWLAAIGWAFLGGRDKPAASTRFDVADLARGAVRLVGYRDKPVIVLHRTQATVAALGEARVDAAHPAWFVALAQAPPNGCRVTWVAQARRFRASCSKASWDAAGQSTGTAGAPPLQVPPHHFSDDGDLVLGDGS